MTVQRICPTHGAYVGKGCPTCRGDRNARPKPMTEARRIRSTPAWKRAAAATIARDGGQCTFGTWEGERFWTGRCPVRDGLDAHHVVPIEDGGEPLDMENLRAVCATHHAQLEAGQRAARTGDAGAPL